MATVTKPKTFDHASTQRKVRHPLHLLRQYIRRYIFLEGAALTLLFASLVFWLGLAFDFGLYKIYAPGANLFGIDWVLELNDLDATTFTSRAIRVVILSAVVIGLLFLGFTKVVTRWFRDFNDKALALVLERRFPKQLGDRLITAVELHDPKLAARYGYSQAMVEKTILEAVERLKTVPVAGVFNWGRLYRLWFLVGLSTVGVWLVVLVLFSGGSFVSMRVAKANAEAKRAAEAEEAIEKGLKPAEPIIPKGEDDWLDPAQFCWKFYDVASIWTERNVLMMNSYWPREAYLEIGRFRPSKNDPNEMRIARDDVTDRPELQVRAYEWVIAESDRNKAPYGWRPLTWKDLAERKLIDPAVLARVKVPADFGHWTIDPAELDPSLAEALFDKVPRERTSGQIREHFALPEVKTKIEQREAAAQLQDWLTWQNWTMDKLLLQVGDVEDPKVRVPLRALNDGEDSLHALEEIESALNELAQAPMMSRTLRKLTVPKMVYVNFRGEDVTKPGDVVPGAGNTYMISLANLADSSKFRFRVRGEDFFTRPKLIALVGAPGPAAIFIDKEEPAYIYHRLEGVDQMALRGERHITRDLPLSTTGDTNTIEVPHGANLVVHVLIDNSPVLWGGLRLNRINYTLEHKLALPHGEGLLVTGVERDSIAAKAGLQANDVLLKVNGSVVPNNLEAFSKVIKDQKKGAPTAFTVLRVKDVVGKEEAALTAVMPEPLPYTPRRLRQERPVEPKDSAILPEGYDRYRGAWPKADDDQLGFTIKMDNLTRKHEFAVEFTDEDNIRGRRRFKIIALTDQEPQLGNLGIFGLTLRKPKFKVPEKAKEGEARDLAELMNAYLITPDAILPFECAVRDDYGLVRVGYQYKYRVEEFDLVAGAAGKKAVDTDAPIRRNGLVVSNFQFWPGNPQSWLFGPHFLGWTAQRLEQDLLQTQNYVEGFAGSEGFEELVKRKRLIKPADIKKSLTLKREAAPWEFDFKDDRNERGEIGFDLRLHLRQLKAVNLEQFGQTHYGLKIAVQATDNNVETGAALKFVEGEGKNEKKYDIRGNTKRNKNGFVNFLVISENELLSQISLEEEVLFQKLEKAKDDVDLGIVRLSEQTNKLRDPDVDMDNILNRMNEIRTALNGVGNNVRETHTAYRNIIEEMRINRVTAKRASKIQNSIFDPLENIVFANPLIEGSGSFPNAEEAFLAAHANVEKDVNLKKRPEAAVHREALADADKQMMKLSNDLKHVLDAMNEGIVEAKLIAILVTLEREQNKITKFAQDLYREQVERLLNPPDEKKGPGIEPKKNDEKKASQLRGPMPGRLAFAVGGPSDADFEVALLDFAPKVQQQISPGQSAAPPWVGRERSQEALKGRDTTTPGLVAPFQGLTGAASEPRAALRSALG